MAEKVFIKNIEWDRIWISFFIEGLDETSNVFIFNSKRTYSFSLKKGNAPDEYKLNITNPGDCKMLPTGIYELFYNSIDQEPPGASYNINWNNPSIKVKTLSKQFIYFHNERAYRIEFTDKNGFKFKASDVQLKGQGTVKNLLSIIRRTKNNTAKTILRAIYNIDYILFHRKLRGKDIHKIKDPRILLMSDQSEEMGSNMVALKNALIREGLNPKEALRAITTKHYSILHWMKTLKKIAWADYIFLDDHSQTTDWLTIKGAVITQLWHAGAGFKSTGYSRFGMPASPAPKSGHRQYTYGIAGSKKIRHFFSEVWGINDEMVLPTGMPRLDEYMDENYIEETANRLLNDYPILCKPSSDSAKSVSTTSESWKDRKRDNIILFAPTYRGENKKHAFYPYDKLDLDRLYKLCEETDSVIIFKMHPFVEDPVPIPEEYKDRMIDLVKYPNINDLFYITDLLITDYSSNIYEFSLMRKPILFYAFDIDEYTKTRGFHRDYRTNVPGKIVETFDDMIQAIEKKDFEYEKVEEYIDNNFEFTDTHACDRIIDWIIRGNLPKN